VQCIMWKKFNEVMTKNSIEEQTSKALNILDSAQANWNAIRIVYGSGNPNVPMENQECIASYTGLHRCNNTHRRTSSPTLNTNTLAFVSNTRIQKLGAPEQIGATHGAISAYFHKIFIITVWKI
jgi:hypothetical protein